MTVPKLIFVADDDPTAVQAFEIRLKAMGLRVATATNGVTAMVMILKTNPDLVILDVGMPGADGLRVCERLREKQFHAPIIMFTGNADDGIISRCNELNARHVLKGALSWTDLQPMICELLEQKPEPAAAQAKPPVPQQRRPVAATAAPKVLVVDDDKRVCQALGIRLGEHGIQALTAGNGAEGFAVALKERPDLVMTDYHMPGGGGDYLIHRLRGASLTKQTPVIVFTGFRHLDGQRDYALERDMRGRGGAVAFLTKPVDFDVLMQELRRHIVIPEMAAAN